MSVAIKLAKGPCLGRSEVLVAKLLLLFCQMKMMDLSNCLLNICAYVHSSVLLSGLWKLLYPVGGYF